MPEERPRLEVLPGGSEPSEPAPLAAAPEPSRARGRAWILGLLLAAALIAVGLQARRAATLSAEVEGLQTELGRLAGELAETETELAAHRSHLDQVRGAVERLQELVSREPQEPGKAL